MEVTALKGSNGDVQHFADRLFAERGVRYGRVAMIPTSAKTKRRPKAHLTIETPVVACPFRVLPAGLTMSVPLPLFPRKRRYGGRRGTSHLCQNRSDQNHSIT